MIQVNGKQQVLQEGLQSLLSNMSGKKNGEWLRLMIQEGFTTDQNLRYEQKL